MSIGIARLFASPTVTTPTTLTGFISPSPALKAGSPGYLTTANVTMYASNGTPPYTYAWSKVSGDDLDVSNPTGSYTTFGGSGSGGETLQAVYQCEVTDDLANTHTEQVNVSIVFIEERV